MLLCMYNVGYDEDMRYVKKVVLVCFDLQRLF